jgi:hypothetical protein
MRPENTMTRPTFNLYHGSHRWEGPPRIVPLRPGHAEHGPGIYFTTSRETAQKYAKGGGKVGFFSIQAPRAWAHEVQLDIDDVLPLIGKIRGAQKRKSIQEDVERIKHRLYGESLINLFVNARVSHGEDGVILAEYLVDRGVDAVRMKNNINEMWVVVVNPLIVTGRRDMVNGDPWDLEMGPVKSMKELATHR